MDIYLIRSVCDFFSPTKVTAHMSKRKATNTTSPSDLTTDKNGMSLKFIPTSNKRNENNNDISKIALFQEVDQRTNVCEV